MGLGRWVGVAAGAVALGLSLLVACGGDDASSTPGAVRDGSVTVVDEASAPVDAGPPATPLEACRAYIQAYCDRLIECGRTSPRCADVEAYCPEYAFADGSTRTVEGVLACTKVRRAQPCGELTAGMTPDCSPAGTLEAGAPCQFVSQCASFNCTEQGTCGTCAAPTTDGRCTQSCNGPSCVTCTVNSECVNGLCTPRVASPDAGAVCSLDAGTCGDASATTTLRAIGEPCTAKSECAGSAECSDAGTCVLTSCP